MSAAIQSRLRAQYIGWCNTSYNTQTLISELVMSRGLHILCDLAIGCYVLSRNFGASGV